VWVANPQTETHMWLPGVLVTAISKAGEAPDSGAQGCQSGVACQIFVQSDKGYADLTAGSQQALKMFISANAAQYFTSVRVGDTVDVDAYAVRIKTGGQNELELEVTLQYPGCAKTKGVGSGFTPVKVTLADLTVSAYEDTVGPLLVEVTNVSGKPTTATATFGLWDTGSINDAGVSTLTSLSPFFLVGGSFTGLTSNSVTDFNSVTGVFGLFFETTSGTKYKELYPRSPSEYPIALVH
jgi:hypothetical protein